MKVLILIPMWKRPEVVSLVFQNLVYFRSMVSWNVAVVAIISPEDPCAKELVTLCKKHSIEMCFFNNDPLGRKMNAGINYAICHYDFDYLMNLGSDDLIHHSIESIYKDYIERKRLLFGLNSLYFIDYKTRKTFFFKCYAFGISLGGGRMISRKLIEELKGRDVCLYDNDIRRGLDSNSSERMRRWANVEEDVILTNGFPYIVDMKTNTNINHIIQIEEHKSQIEYKPDNFLKSFYAVL